MNNKNQLVLIVDDNKINLQVLGNILKDAGYSISAARNGREALEFTERIDPDLILLDIIMPEMDGFEVCRQLKENQKTKKIPVIFLTAKAETEYIIKGFEIGGEDYVTKPFNHAELLARVSTHIKLKQAIDEIKTLRGFIPICSCCKKIRDDEGFWEKLENFISDRTEVEFTHGICPECAQKFFPELYNEK